jgi:hypothetical protein
VIFTATTLAVRMDCRDRFAVWLVELVLEPVRALRENGDAGPVTVRAACADGRFDITIRREGDLYRWSYRDVAEPANETSSSKPCSDPEDAFWAAWTAIETAA